ncbi:MAG: hypothetical protein ABJN42_04865 [Roseibium sp.]|uniref:hypothetical protein n=1 Tax=Alphaproteobacteria TaxID=28211 RepID=UPI0032991A6C
MQFHLNQNGYEALAYFLPFAGEIHTFNDHNHAKNFVRYLFSKSRAHPVNHLTKRNLICENVDGALTRTLNTEPERLLRDFMDRRFPARAAQETLCDDGFYGLFAVRLPDGRAYSNFLKTTDDVHIEVHHPITRYLGNIDVSPEAFEEDVLKFAFKGPVDEFEDVDDPKIMKPIDSILHGLVHKKTPSPGEVVLSVSHRDQLDHNQTWHIHRLIAA